MGTADFTFAGPRAFVLEARRGGRPIVPIEIRRLILEMSIANPLWGAPRIHGELLKLGIDIGQTSVAKYMCKSLGRTPSPICPDLIYDRHNRRQPMEHGSSS